MSRNLILIYILLTIIYIGAPFTARAAGAEVEINFNGELVSTTCQISASSVKKDIVLENLRRKTINETGTSDTTLFSIGIDKCSQTVLQKDVKLTWKSNKLVTIGEQDFIATDGESGVLLGVVDKDNKPVLWNTPSSIGAISIAENEQKFNFGVFVRKPVTGEAKVGNFTSIITFSVEYQ